MEKSFKLHITAVLLLIVSVLIYFLLFGGVGQAYAATSAYSFVMDDLQKDSAFDASKYPKIAGNKSLQVIQIAESSEGELFIYVYQPGGQSETNRASSINIARELDNATNLSFKNYGLEYLNSSDVFYKYKVKNFELEKSPVRYYNISNIYRDINNNVSHYAAGGNTVVSEANRVGQLWTVITGADGQVSYHMTGTDVVVVENMYVGYVDLNGGVQINGLNIEGKHTIRNFIAFSTDHDIDRLIEAEVVYSMCDISFGVCANPLCGYHTMNGQFNKKVGDPQEPITKTLKADEKSESVDFGWGGHKYTWNDIQSTAEFIKDNNNSDYKLTTEGTNDIKDTQWVLNFHNAELDAKGEAAIWDNHAYFNGQTVHDATILRLMVETDGVTYNLGVVANKQVGDGKADNESKSPLLGGDFWEWLAGKLNVSVNGAKAIVYGVIALIVLAILLPVLSAIFPAFGQVLLWLVKGLLIIISLPFRAIAALFKKRKESAPAKARSTSRPRKRNAGKTSRKKSAGTRRS